MNFGFLVSIFFSFPVVFFLSRNNFIVIMKMIFQKDTKNANKKENQDYME